VIVISAGIFLLLIPITTNKPWKELHYIKEMAITDYLEQGSSEETAVQSLYQTL
jgi:hypothetical protein